MGPTISVNRQSTILRWSLLYSRGFLRETPEGPPIVLRSRYTYIIILFEYNIIYIIFPRLLVFPTDVLWFGENPVAFGENPVTFFWPSCGLPVAFIAVISIPCFVGKTQSCLLGKNL